MRRLLRSFRRHISETSGGRRKEPCRRMNFSPRPRRHIQSSGCGCRESSDSDTRFDERILTRVLDPVVSMASRRKLSDIDYWSNARMKRRGKHGNIPSELTHPYRTAQEWNSAYSDTSWCSSSSRSSRGLPQLQHGSDLSPSPRRTDPNPPPSSIASQSPAKSRQKN